MLMNLWFSMQMQDNKAQDMHANYHYKNHLSNTPKLKYLLVRKQSKYHINKIIIISLFKINTLHQLSSTYQF